MTAQLTEIRKRDVLATVSLFDADGATTHVITWKAAKEGRGANNVGSADHIALLERVIAYFHLEGPVSNYTRHPRPDTTDGLGVTYSPTEAVYIKGVQYCWTIQLKTNQGKRWAYVEDDGTLYQEIQEKRNRMVAEVKAAKAPRVVKEPKPEKVVSPTATWKNLPLDAKPKEFDIGKGPQVVKVFAKTVREMKNPNGAGRIVDPSAKRTAEDDVITFKATSYQLGKVSKIIEHPKAIVIVGANGLAILQTIRVKNIEAYAELLFSIKEKSGYGGKPVAAE